jgi:signal recognition particle GTPase
MNGPYVEKWLKGLKHYIANQVKTVDKTKIDPRINFIKDVPHDTCVVPRYLHTILIEGVAGSGKTQAILKLLFKMIRSNSDARSKLLSHAFVASIGQEEAEKLS